MRIRPFFWIVLIISCVSVLTFAFFLRRDIPASLQLSLDQATPKAFQTLTLTVHLTDHEGVPIDSAQVTSHINMTNMDMGAYQHALAPTGHGRYNTQLQLSMVGPWLITVIVQADGFAPVHRELSVNAT